ncbi:MAG: hypothetical protein H7Y06_04270, partial [Opitutaceae bacterium]|nr:hypothetical protein [Opitutaceae bacterium]
KDRQQPRFPWYSYLDEAPRMAHDVPWAEIGRVPGKPFFLYETQAMNPSKYRAEFPYRLLALGAIQDWDIINWHCLPRPVLAEEERPYDKAMELAHGGFQAEGFHFRFDEVQSAAMRTAAHMFRTGAYKPVEKPTTVTFGTRSLYDPANMDYGKSFGDFGERITPTTYRYGLYMKVDPTRTDDLIEGPSVLPRLNEANPIRPTNEIAFDWQRSHLVMDAPSAVSYTGFYAQHGGPVRFANGITLDNVSVANPEGMVYPVGENEKFIAFGAVAQDGLPLDKSRHVLVSLVSTSFNTGYQINEDNVASAKKTDDIYRGMVTGKAPVLVARVGATLTAPQFTGMKYRLLDWHMKPIGEGVVKDGLLPISATAPIFNIELTR